MESKTMKRFARTNGAGWGIWVISFCLLLASLTEARSQVLTLPADQRPEWLEKEGVVMAGSWEPLTYRTREGTFKGHAPTKAEQEEWEYEHSPEVTKKLKRLGVNFIMMHCYKGAGLKIEGKTMDDAVRFARQYHQAGLHVGVYVYSGAFLWEPMYREIPESQNWVLLDKNYKPSDYYHMGIRYYWNRNNPDAQAFYKKIIRFAVDSVKADLLHFDNYSQGPGRDANSVNRFREYLRHTFPLSERKKIGAADLSLVVPPMNVPPHSLLDCAWLKFKSVSLTQSYKDMGGYARSLRKDILLELNCGAPENKIRWINHGELLQGGEAVWSEGVPSGYYDGKYRTRIISYKIARCLNNIVFYYANTPVSMAESMAFNADCLGMICSFENGKVVTPGPDKSHKIEEVMPYIRFYKTRRGLFRDAKVIADIAVLRSYSSEVFSDPANADLTSSVEQYCVNERIPFQILYDNQLDRLSQYRSLVLAGCVALSDTQIQKILAYLRQGGHLCIIGPVAKYNEWMVPRLKNPFDSLPSNQIMRTEDVNEIGKALSQSVGGYYSFDVAGKEGLYAEYTATQGRRLVHLVNFRPERPVTGVKVSVRIPEGRSVKSVRIAGPLLKEDRKVSYTAKGRTLYFTVPEVKVYDVAIVEFNGGPGGN
jgi:hypothetical protein